jgi:hypothetical protein
LEESVWDFASTGTVSLAHVAEAAKSQSDDEAVNQKNNVPSHSLPFVSVITTQE